MIVCLSESRGGSSFGESIFSYCGQRYYKERYSEVQNCNHGEFSNFRTVRGNKATDLDGSDNLYVHCVSKERLELLREGMSWVELELLVLWITTTA